MAEEDSCKHIRYNESTRHEIDALRTEVFVREFNVPESRYSDVPTQISKYFGYYKDGKLVGYCRIYEYLPHVHRVEQLCVKEGFRREGIGRQLLLKAIRYLRTMCDEGNSINVLHGQAYCIELFLSLGYVIISDLFSDNDTGHWFYLMVFPYSQFDRFSIFTQKYRDNYMRSIKPHYEFYDVEIRSRLLALQVRFSGPYVPFFNICSLPWHLDVSILGQRIFDRIVEYCTLVMKFLGDDYAFVKGAIPLVIECGARLEEIVEKENYLLKMANEKINTAAEAGPARQEVEVPMSIGADYLGHYDAVPDEWKQVFAIVSFVKALHLARRGLNKEAMAVVDEGICKGVMHERLLPMRRFAEQQHCILRSEDGITATVHDAYIKYKYTEGLPDTRTIPIQEIHASMDLSGALVPNSDRSDISTQTVDRLYNTAITEGFPLIFRGLARDMKAFDKWTFQYLSDRLYYRSCPIEIGSGYADEGFEQKIMSFGSFINSSPEKQYYFAQHKMFDMVPWMRDDIIIPHVCLGEYDDDTNVDLHLWVGPQGTVSPLHQDPRENMFCQIRGEKAVRLIKPGPVMDKYRRPGIHKNTSFIDPEKPDKEKFPEFENLEVFMGHVHVGDVLYIPKGWWHHVRSTAPSISVSMWYDLPDRTIDWTIFTPRSQAAPNEQIPNLNLSA